MGHQFTDPKHPKDDPKAGKGLHCDDKMEVDPETHELRKVDGVALDAEKEYLIQM